MKKIICIILVATLAISLDCVASIVNDDDSSSFITNAEFDATKNVMASQIKEYNNNIDAKIDNAIENYLSLMSLDRNEAVTSNISNISYPLKVINVISSIKNLDSPTNHQTEPFYSPGYSLYGFIHRGYSAEGRTGINYLGIKPKRKWEKWLNGEWNSSNNKFIVNGMSNGLDYTFSGATYHDGDHEVNDLEAFFLSLDYYAAVSQVSNQANNSNRTNGSNRLLNDYESFTNTDGSLECVFSPGIFAGVSGATTNVRFNYGATDSLDTWKFTGASNIWYNRVKCLNTLRSYSYNPVKTDLLTEIYNCGLYYDASSTEYNNTSYKAYLAPVTMGANQTIYLTNVKKYRQVKNNEDVTKGGWWKRYNLQTGTGFCFTGVITTGYNIESEYSASSTTTHPKNKRSALKQNDLYYNFDKVTGERVEHHMVDGIPILSLEKTYASKLNKATIELNISSQNSSNQKYAIFSTKPIRTQKYSDNVETNTDYISITNINGTDTNVKKVQLNEGINVIDLEENKLKPEDVLYFKLLYNDANEDYVTIETEPKITLYFKMDE